MMSQMAGDSSGLRIRLLGGFRAEVDTRVIADSEWRLQKARGLVKLLALAPTLCPFEVSGTICATATLAPARMSKDGPSRMADNGTGTLLPPLTMSSSNAPWPKNL